jgi:hypothetical protein
MALFSFESPAGVVGMSIWNPQEIARQKQQFIAQRVDHVGGLGLFLVFAVTAAATWFWAQALLSWGLRNLPLRYAITGVVAYAVFACCVRVWADFQKRIERKNTSTSELAEASLDAASSFDEAGCVVVIGVALAWVLGIAAFGALWAFGGIAALLEVAFEVAFAGVVVRSLRKTETVGDWLGVLLRKTALPAALITLAAVGFAAWGQSRFPQAVTLGDVLAQLRASK